MPKRIKVNNENKKINKVKKVVKKTSKKEVQNNEESSNNKINKVNNNKINIKINNKINKKSNNKVFKTDEYFKFNEVLHNALKNKNIFKTNLTKVNEKAKFKTVEDYQNDFDDIMSFKKGLTKKDVDEIDLIVYHDENNDGIFSAAIAYHYLKTLNKNKDIKLIGLKPMKGHKVFIKNPEIYKNKNVLIVDLDYNNQYLQTLSNYCNNIIIIDDHDKTDQKDSDKIHVFRNRMNIHGTVAYVWKFFYPKEDVPLTIQLIDDSDMKLFLPFIPRGFSNNFTQAIGHRYVHNKNPNFIMKKRSGELFNELWEFISEKSINFLVFAGYYYQEVIESLKNQIAINARPAKFQGYDVAVLNFNAPNLKKQVGRQIMSNYRAMGSPIKFCVLWGYEYTNNCYDITLMDDHRPTSTINLKEIAEKLGKIGGTIKGGGGHQHESHFYWPMSKTMDIWDLFEKKFI